MKQKIYSTLLLMVLAVTSAWAQTPTYKMSVKHNTYTVVYDNVTLSRSYVNVDGDWTTEKSGDNYNINYFLWNTLKQETLYANCTEVQITGINHIEGSNLETGDKSFTIKNPAKDFLVSFNFTFKEDGPSSAVSTCTNWIFNFSLAHESHTISSTEWENYIDGSNKAYHYRPCTDNTSYCEMNEAGSFTSDEGTLTSWAECTYDDDDDYICNVCGFENESRKPALVHTHDFSPNWTFTEETTDPNYGKHWHECLGYGADATCIADAGAALAEHTYGEHKHETSYYTCTVCSFEDPTRKTEYKDHVFAAAWTNDATYHWHACTAEGYDDACLDKLDAAKGEHVYGTMGDTRFTCQICGAEDDTKKPHTTHAYATAWSTDATSHWHECTAAGICDAPKADEAQHVYSTNIQEEAYYKCSVCSHENHARKSVATNQSPAWGWTYEIPYDFEVTDVVNDRQFVAATDKQAYTICLPYDLTLPASVEIYTLSASKDDQVGFAKLATNEIKALTPYLIIPTMSGQLLNLSGGNIKKTNATLVAANDATSVAVSGQQTYTLKGSMSYMDGPAAADNIYIMQGENKWEKTDGGSYTNATNKASILPMRAYLTAAGAAPSRLFSFFDQTTGIQRTVVVDADSKPVVYDLQGRKVSAPQRGGIYIINGKKVLVK